MYPTSIAVSKSLGRQPIVTVGSHIQQVEIFLVTHALPLHTFAVTATSCIHETTKKPLLSVDDLAITLNKHCDKNTHNTLLFNIQFS